jgi:hypothetical protein
MDNLLNPGPHGLQFGTGVPRCRTAHLTNPTALQGGIKVDSTIRDVSWADRDWIAGERSTGIARSRLVLGGIDDQNGPFVQPAENLQGLSNRF